MADVDRGFPGDDERERLARDLQDALAPQITALRVTLDLIASMTSASPGALPELVERCCLLADRLDSDIEAFACDMRPAPVASAGLPAAIHGYVADWSRQCGVGADVTVEGLDATSLQDEAARHLYHLLQEALRNVHKHGDATHVRVVLERVNSDVRLRVEDDRHGLDIPATLVFIQVPLP